MKTAFRVSVSMFNSNCHTKKAVYVSLKSFKFEPEWAQFTRVGQTITLHHSEMMRLILDYNAHIELRNGIPEEVATTESGGEEEDRPLAVMKPPLTKKKATPVKKTVIKKAKQTPTTDASTSSITSTLAEEITIESD